MTEFIRKYYSSDCPYCGKPVGWLGRLNAWIFGRSFHGCDNSNVLSDAELLWFWSMAVSEIGAALAEEPDNDGLWHLYEWASHKKRAVSRWRSFCGVALKRWLGECDDI